MDDSTRADTARLAAIDEPHLHALRDALERHGYDGDMLGVCEGWAPGQLDAIRVPLVLHELRRRDDAAAALARLFAYDDALLPARIDELLGADVVVALLDAGVLEPREGGIGSRVRIVPFDTLWIASDDWARAIDPVMGPGPTTLELARALDVVGVSTLLDVGCGAGSLALWARAQGVAEVVGVDIDARAIDYARFNARLNALPCEWATGDLSAPVRGRRFDAVVSQPAYVPQPPTVGSTTYLHGGARGDELALRLLGEIPGLLAEHGRAWVLFDTPAARPAELSARVRDALREPNLDTLVLATAPQSTRTHTIAYASLVDPQLGAGYRDAVERYAKHFEAIGVTELRHVLLVAQHTSDRATATVLEPPSLRGFDGATLARVRAGAKAAQASDDALLDTAVVPAADAWLVYEESLDDEPRTRSRVQFDGHRGIGQGLSDTAAVLLQSLRDHQPLHAAIEAQAAAIDAEPDELVASVLEFVRGGLVSGLLVVRG